MKKVLFIYLLVSAFLCEAGYKTSVSLGDDESVISELNGRWLTIIKSEKVEDYTVYHHRAKESIWRFYFQNKRCVKLQQVVSNYGASYIIANYREFVPSTCKIKSDFTLGNSELEWIEMTVKRDTVFEHKHLYRVDKYSQYYLFDITVASSSQKEAFLKRLDNLRKEREQKRLEQERTKLEEKRKRSAYLLMRRDTIFDVTNTHKEKDISRKVHLALEQFISESKSDYLLDIDISVTSYFNGKRAVEISTNEVKNVDVSFLKSKLLSIQLKKYYKDYNDIAVNYSVSRIKFNAKKETFLLSYKKKKDELILIEGDKTLFDIYLKELTDVSTRSGKYNAKITLTKKNSEINSEAIIEID